MCSYDPSFYLRLRGLCTNSAIDVFYKPLNSWKDYRQLTLQGIKNSLITYDEKQKGWNLKTGGSSVKAFSKAPHWSFTVGKHNWTIKGDNDCNVEEESLKELKMSGCKDNEFTCSDGQCVSMLKRCNQLPNCRMSLMRGIVKSWFSRTGITRKFLQLNLTILLMSRCLSIF